MASIARTYDCSPPAISYIVSRSRARRLAPEPQPSVAAAAEPQLVKNHTAPLAGPDSSAIPPSVPAATAEAPAALHHNGNGERSPATAESVFAGNGVSRHGNGAAPQGSGQMPQGNGLAPHGNGNGEARRTLHLSLGGSNGHAPRPQNYQPAFVGAPQPDAAATASSATGGHPTSTDRPDRPFAEQAPPALASQPMPRPAMAEPAMPRNGNDGGAFLDQALRDRVDGDIAAFLTAFDAALAGDTVESRAELRAATDRLLRAGARTRIELERLEARMPLPPRDKGGHPASAWRPR